ncbi:MAG: Gfo/Idh/MocA family oxidoreductase [Pseudomonadota bacterium]
MSEYYKPRLRFFESAGGQRHIARDDHYLYRQADPIYRAAIIGTGTIGMEHMRVAALLGRIRVHGIYDASAHSMEVASEEYRRYSDDTLVRYQCVEDVCRDADVDVIFICTPNHTHIDVLRVVAQGGKALFLEKPMATTLEDAGAIATMAQQYPSFIQVGLQYRFKAPYLEAYHEALERRVLGRLHSVAMREFRPPFLDKVAQWNKFARYSGGTLIEKCCHYFDLINLFAGSRPRRVYAVGQQATNYKDFEYGGERSDIDDLTSTIIEYESGVHATFSLSMSAPNFYEDLTLCGSRGRLVATESFDFQRSDKSEASITIELGEHGPSRHTDLSYTDLVETSGHHGGTFFEHVALADRLDGKPSAAATPLQGLWSVVVAAAAQASIDSGNPVEIEALIESHQLGDLLASEQGID